MADFQDVDVAEQAALQQEGLHRRLRVAGEQRLKAAALEQHHHRRVVDVAVDQRRVGVSLSGKEDGQACVDTQRNDVPGPRQADLDAGLGPRQRREARIGRVFVRASRLEDGADRESLERRHQPGHVVLVRMGQHHHVQAPLPERQPFAKAAQGEIGVRPAVDQRGLARWCDDQDRFSLADVQRHQVQPPVRPCRHG
jgi:hypothetical protein